MLMQQLKTETRDLHDQVERNPMMAQLMTPQLTREAYQAVLERLLGLHEPFEAHLHRQVDALPADLNLEARRKTPWLVADLKAIGHTDASLQALPRWEGWLPESVGESLGALYVLEGATLGGKVISKQIHRTLGITPETGLRFYTSYGDALGPMWKTFMKAINTTYGHQAEVAVAAVRGARATFTAMDQWLLEADPVVA